MSDSALQEESHGSGHALQGLADILLLAASLIALGLSLWFWFTEQPLAAIFVGVWVPSILAFGTFLNSRQPGTGS